MAKGKAQRLKLYYLYEILKEYTDFEHFISMKRIIDLLEMRGIDAERKSLYEDIEALKSIGVKIDYLAGPDKGYYLVEHDFDTAELKLMADAVKQSRFITMEKSSLLTKKIAHLGSVHQREIINAKLTVSQRVKSMNESVYYNVDALSDAISREKMVSFRYYDRDMCKKKRYHNNGEFYTISPFALIWDNMNYYLVGNDEDAGVRKNFRVDKMTQLTVTENNEKKISAKEQNEIEALSYRCFSMFSGEEKYVRLLCDQSIAGIILDRFGDDTEIIVNSDNNFTVYVKVAVSPQFYSWVFGLEDKIEIIEPIDVRRGYAGMMKKLLAKYKLQE